MTSHRRSQLKRSLVAGFAVAALAAPVAHAGPMLEPGSGDASPLPDRPSVTTTIDQGFDWGSAAIGAGGAGALLVLLSVGGMAYASRERPGDQTAARSTATIRG